MIYSSVAECIGQTPIVALNRHFANYEVEVFAKLEFLNPGGSVKDRPARFIIESALKNGLLQPGASVIESTSGNLGIALAMLARIYGLNFTCVVDPKITPSNLAILRQLGAKIEMVYQPDDQGGYLKTRLKRVQELLQSIPNSFWINQYANQLNWQAHYYGEGEEIIRELKRPLDAIFVAVSTTGTILGLARRLRQNNPALRVVAVDAVGSVIFGGLPSTRELPGIGSSRVPELLDTSLIDEVVYVNDTEATESCRRLALSEGMLVGGSSGSVVAAIEKQLPFLPAGSRILTVFADRGERYLDTVYNDQWVARYCAQPNLTAV